MVVSCLRNKADFDSVGFEISYIILTQARHILNPNTASASLQNANRSFFTCIPPPSAALQIKGAIKGESEASRDHAERDMLLKILGSTVGNAGSSGKMPALTLKKTMPFSSTVDDGSIVHLDNEWLYDYPKFLLTPKLPDATKLMRLLSEQASDNSRRPTLGPGTHELGVIEQQLQPYVSNPNRRFEIASEDSTRTFVAQIPKQKHRKHQAKRTDKPSAIWWTNSDLWEYKLSDERSDRTAKKRFIWLPRANSQTALLCWMASVESERIPMALFFDRHWRYESHLWDDTTRQSNTWQTELHLSFYTVVAAEIEGDEGFPTPITFAFSGASRKKIAHAAMGFRFDGDFFDRYWTCHFIQHMPDIESDSIEWDFLFDPDGSGRYNEKHWWQRKVLEIYLLHRILSEIIRGSKKVLEQVREELKLEEKNLSNLSLAFLNTVNKKTHPSSKDRWPDIQIILRAIDDELTSALGILRKWQSREEDRGKEQPRWTRNDERKYRGYINTFRAQTDRQIWDLEMSRDDAHMLLETITTKQEQLRTESEARHEGNIRNFTYVTVIFLPLGFATSLYSMNGPPQYLWLISLVESSAAAFAVTLFLVLCMRLLLHYKVPDKVRAAMREGWTRLLFFMGEGWTRLLLFNLDVNSLRAARRDSWLSRSQSSPPNEDGKPDEPHPKPTGWMSFIFLQIPARRVSIAISQLKDGKQSLGAAALHVILGALSSLIYVVARAFQVLPSLSYGYVRSIVRISGKLLRSPTLKDHFPFLIRSGSALSLCYFSLKSLLRDLEMQRASPHRAQAGPVEAQPQSQAELPKANSSQSPSETRPSQTQPGENSEAEYRERLENASFNRFKRMTMWESPASLKTLNGWEELLRGKVDAKKASQAETAGAEDRSGNRNKSTADVESNIRC